ncbi:MAG: rhodanese-like domain-containing protein [Bacteroidales bacterium]|nr:rhodanese-like domain-containing protein [Bacteroidales bacterium]
MNSRIIISLLLVTLGIILAFLPAQDKPSLKIKPEKVLFASLDKETSISPDELARLIVAEDSSLQIIDVRTPLEYSKFSIPGSINLPYNEIVNNPDTLENILNRDFAQNIFYSNGDLESNYAFTLAQGLGFKKVSSLDKGLNGWFKYVMNSEFVGTRITARENALFETRAKAKRLFIEINSLPDSLKTKYMQSKQAEARKLDGGCE